ncbi:MAG: hypothetical protein FWC26_01460 [Fibromonadales bacterium]|nr:hypothetical protein [Fibromonadales bacterium]
MNRFSFLFLFFETFAFAYELEKIGNIDKYDTITAEYCMSWDADRGWKLLRYEQYAPLILNIQTKSYDYDYTISVSLDADIKFSTIFLKQFGSTRIGYNPNTKKGFKGKIDRNEEHNIYDSFGTLYTYQQKIDTAKISVLFNKVFPVKWNIKFEIDYQPLDLSGSYNAKISGICNEEQLKKIEGKKLSVD